MWDRYLVYWDGLSEIVHFREHLPLALKGKGIDSLRVTFGIPQGALSNIYSSLSSDMLPVRQHRLILYSYYIPASWKIS